ncbi:MAG: hypothetical protein ACTSR1_10625 [Candidatus Heimdallarchaeota archaeon]
MEIAEDLGLQPFEITAEQIPSIVLKLDLDIPTKNIDQVILVIIDNFSLYEVITYQPMFMIKNLEYLLLIDTETKSKSLSGPMLESMFFSKESLTFNLISALNDNQKQVKVHAREEDLPKITNDSNLAVTETSDVNIYVKGLKAVNRNDLLVLHFSDFDEMYARYSMNPPEEIASKIIRRTDKWLSLFWQQAIEGTALIVIGNDGKTPIEMNLEGRAAEWKRANLPIGFIKFPEKNQ